MTPHSCVRYFLIEHYTSHFTSFVNKMLWSIKTKSSNRTSDHKLLLFRYFSEAENNTGFMGHFCGALAGLLVGIFVLDNRRIQTGETFIQWISIGVFSLLMGFAIIWNVYGDTWYKEIYGIGRFFPKPDYQLYDDASGNCKHYQYL